MTLILHSAIRNDVGLVRANNEDSALAGARLIAVADGMGGLPAGELASEIVIRILDELIPPTTPEEAEAALRRVLVIANQRIRAAIEADAEREGMGTTLTAALLAGDTLVIAQVGDSRCYLLRHGRLGQLTRDDTFVQALVDQGVLSRAEARQHPQRSLVTRAVQGADTPPTVSLFPVAPGDRLLVCSDGLSDYVDDDSIGAALVTCADREHCAEQLVKLAHQAGAPDNVTVVISDVTAT